MALDTQQVDAVIARLGSDKSNLIPILQAVQDHYRYLPQEAMERICQITDITPAEVTGVASFYGQFRFHPTGQHLIRICHGTACHVKGAGLVTDALLRHLKIEPDSGSDTDAAGLFTVEKVACLGCCTLAPVMQVDQVTYGHLTPSGIGQVLADFLELAKRRGSSLTPHAAAAEIEAPGEIRIGMGSCCVARGSQQVREALEQLVRRTHIAATIRRVGCVGMCHQTPLVEIVLPGQPPHLYALVRPEDVEGIVLRHFRPRGLLRKVSAAARGAINHVWDDQSAGALARYTIDYRDPPVKAFLDPQCHLATELCGHLDPTDLDAYRRTGGFAALEQARTLRPEDLIERVRASGLRGRGGAGFRTGLKWRFVREAAGDFKYVVCNGDEGDPGAFMDRMILESYPYRVLEGIAIAAHAVGARQGVLYIRAEYPLAVKRVQEAMDRCRDAGLIFDQLDLRIMQGAGAFVCGEETALLASIEGGRGMPRLRPPFPATSGLWQKPTLVNNVETFALVPWIVRSGAEAFSALGTAESKGTKVFALAGKVVRGGLIEVPMGVSIRQIVFDIGGGIPDGKQFKAVQVGGPSGGCLPAALADTSVDYEALTAAGAIMGSGGLVVLDEDDCMVDIARYFLQFTQEQSCGKCTHCRIGTRRMLDILERLCAGQGRHDDLKQLEELAHMVQRGSLCGLGKTAPNPILTTLRYFHDEYMAHLAGHCPAGRCKALVRYAITDDCIGCTLCAQQCPADAIAMRPYEKHEVDDAKCVRCGSCKSICPVQAVKIESGPKTQVRTGSVAQTHN